MKTRADIVKDLAPNSIVMELGVAACFKWMETTIF